MYADFSPDTPVYFIVAHVVILDTSDFITFRFSASHGNMSSKDIYT